VPLSAQVTDPTPAVGRGWKELIGPAALLPLSSFTVSCVAGQELLIQPKSLEAWSVGQDSLSSVSLEVL
jgi:hypothetical protein